jgi:hypothetical protein
MSRVALGSQERLAIHHQDRLGAGIEILKQPRVHLDPERAGNRSFRLAVPKRRSGPRTELIAAPLVGRDPIACRGEENIVFVILIGPQDAALGAGSMFSGLPCRAASPR